MADVVLQAQLTALKKQGASLAADRERLVDMCESLQESRDFLMATVTALEEDLEKMTAERDRLSDMKHDLLRKLVEAKRKSPN